MKILLLGKNGQVGWQLQRALAPLGEIVALERKDAGGDLADPQGLAAAVRAAKPQVIVNAAAYTAVDKAESEPQLARLINTEAPAAHDTYPGGGGYVAAKHAERVIATTLRQELVGQPVRVIEIAPGMVATEEFSLNRFHGDRERADAVYAGVAAPLVAADVAECLVWALERPAHVNIDCLVVRPRAQATNTLVARA